MSSSIILKGGRILDPASGRDEVGDLFLHDGRIVARLSEAEAKNAEVFDATGKIVTPGLVDVHVHFREPGQTHKETIASGSRAAAAGGFTTVVAMPNTSPCCDSPATIRLMQSVIDRDALVRVLTTGTITLGMNGEQLAPAGSLKNAGVVALTDDGKCVQNNEIMRRAIEYAHMHGLPVLDHCQDYALSANGVMNEGEWSARLGLPGWPNAAEDIIVSRDVILSEYTGAHVHLQHISSANAVDIIRRAKARGVRISAEATPHHLALTDDCLRDYHPNFKMNPPLRTEADRLAVLQGLLDGTLDCVATDHAPHTRHEKNAEFDRTPFGIIGLETAFPIAHQIVVGEGGASLPFLIEAMTCKPARLLNLDAGTLREGAAADVCILDLAHTWTVERRTLQSKSANSPWRGQQLTGRAVATIVGGRWVWRDGAIVA